jgi:hypothetical protein
MGQIEFTYVLTILPGVFGAFAVTRVVRCGERRALPMLLRLSIFINCVEIFQRCVERASCSFRIKRPSQLKTTGIVVNKNLQNLQNLRPENPDPTFVLRPLNFPCAGSPSLLMVGSPPPPVRTLQSVPLWAAKPLSTERKRLTP